MSKLQGFPDGSAVKESACNKEIHLPMQETQVRALDQEDALEEEVTNHSSILAWKIPWRERTWWATVHRVAKSQIQLRD